MTTYYLIRHGSTDYIGKELSGRMGGIHLNETGRREVEGLAQRLAHAPLQAVYSSPLERALETAEPVARRVGSEVRVSQAFHELNFGDWEGSSFGELHGNEHWQRFNTFRSGVRPPGGELMLEAQARAVAEMERLRLAHAGESIAIISHADVIRAILCHYAAIPLDLLQRIEISPASLSILVLHETGPEIRAVNYRADDGFFTSQVAAP